MSSNLDQLTANAMKLPLRDRVQLAQRLVSTLDDEVDAAGAEELWFGEAERRLEELRSGHVQGIDSVDTFRTAREALKQCEYPAPESGRLAIAPQFTAGNTRVI